MTDIIKKAIENRQDTNERVADGTVDEHDVLLEKTEYEIEQRGPTAWKVAVYFDGEGPLPAEQSKGLEADEAQEIFDELVEKYNLRE